MSEKRAENARKYDETPEKNNYFINEGKWQFGGEFWPKISEKGQKIAQNEWKKGQKRPKIGQNPRKK